MHPVEKGKIVSCQIAYAPINTTDYMEEINEMLNLIKESDLSYNIGILSTTIQGSIEEILDLIAKINELATYEDRSYVMNIALSNICGCER